MPYEWNHNNIPYPVILPCGHSQPRSPDGKKAPATGGKPTSRPRSKTIERGSGVHSYMSQPPHLPPLGTAPATAIPLCCSPHEYVGKHLSPTDDFADVFLGCRSKHGSYQKEKPQQQPQQKSSPQKGSCRTCADAECYDCLPRKSATKQQCIDARIPSAHETSQWDPSISRPLTLRTYVFDCVSIGRYIHEWAKLSKNEDIVDAARRLRAGLRNLANSVNSLKVHMDTRKKVHGGSHCSSSTGGSSSSSAAAADGTASAELDVGTAKYFVKRANAILDRFESILEDTTEKMAASVENVRGMELISFLFDEEMDKTQNFVKDIEVWSTRFNTNCGQAMAAGVRA